MALPKAHWKPALAVVRAASVAGAGRGFWIPACAGMTSGAACGAFAGCCAVRVRAVTEIQPSPATPAASQAHQPTTAQSRHYRRRPVSSATLALPKARGEPARPWCGRLAGVAVPGVVSGFGLRRNDEQGSLRRRSAAAAPCGSAPLLKSSQVPRPRPHPPTRTTLNPVIPAKAGISAAYGVAEAHWNQHGRGAGGQRVWIAGRGFWIPGLRRNDEAGWLAGGALRLLRRAGPRGCTISPATRPHPPTSTTPNPVIPAKAGIQCGLWNCQGAREPARPMALPKAHRNQHGRGAGGQQVWRAGRGF